MESIVGDWRVHIPYTSVPETRGNGGKPRDMKAQVGHEMEAFCEDNETRAS
jgi:hypothetical protein